MFTHFFLSMRLGLPFLPTSSKYLPMSLTLSNNLDVTELAQVFDRLFYETWNTKLEPSPSDPIYLPASDECSYHRIMYYQDFFSSALHEISHWCIAGEKRRTQIDFGYWYKPERSKLEEQELFERYETKVQGLEWVLSSAAGKEFFVSCDCFDQSLLDLEKFRKSITKEALRIAKSKCLPVRTTKFITALRDHFGVSKKQFDDYWEKVEIGKVMAG